jgi:hypothetical protein
MITPAKATEASDYSTHFRDSPPIKTELGTKMDVNGLPIPLGLIGLIECGKWSAQASAPGAMVDVGKEKARRLSEDADQLILMPPPFHTIADEVTKGNQFWEKDLSNVGEIDYSRAVIIADFGLGSDSPVILYYGEGHEPSVMYLKWIFDDTKVRHSWVQTHASFDEFARDVGLAGPTFP